MSPLEIGIRVLNAVVALATGATGLSVPAPVKSPCPSGSITRRATGAVLGPTLMRHLTSVPLTGERRPPAARRPGSSALLAQVPRPESLVGVLERSLPIVTVAQAGPGSARASTAAAAT